jgi:lipoprotein NlpI
MKSLYRLSFLFFNIVTFSLHTSQVLAADPQTFADKLSQRITVQIKGKNHGSGVIIKRQGNVYTVLSAAHVFNDQAQYSVFTSDYQHHAILKTSIRRFPKIDLAIAQFTSNQSYPIVQLGNSTQVTRGLPIYISGYTSTPNKPTPTYHLTLGKIEVNASYLIDKGYGLAFYSKTYPGMSGGPVLDAKGKLIGIQGLSLVPPIHARSINPLGDITDRFYMAIPINTFIELSSTVDPTLKVEQPKPMPVVQTLTADDYFIQGNLHSVTGDRAAALNSYSNAIRIAPDYASAYYGRANLRADAGDKKGALSDYTQAIQLNPHYTQAYYYRGTLYTELGQFQNAIMDYEQALRLNPNLAVAYNNRGTIRFRQGDVTGAISDYDQALQRNPSLRDAYNNRGLARYRSGDFKGALKDYDRAIELEPTRANTHNSRGLVYAALGNRQAAKRDMQKAADLYRSQGYVDHYNQVLEQIQKTNQ